MTETKLIQLNNNERVQVLEKLGYYVDNEGFIKNKKTKKEVICKYNGEKVHINIAAILPGSALIINATPVSMAQYFVEHYKDE